MTCSFQLRVVAACLKNRETSLPHFTQAFILLLKTASGPSRYVPLCLSPAPPLLEPLPPHTPPAPPPSPCLACHERDAEAALLLSTSSIFICQTAVSTAVLAGLQCFVCSVEFVGVHVVCACARAQFHDSCGLVCILVLCVKGGKKKKRQSAILLYYRSLLGAKYGWGSPCFAWKSLEWTRVYVTKTMWKLWETSKIFSSSYWCPK